MYVLDANNVTKTFNKKVILDNMSLQIKKGTIFALLGPNGAGKTTFVKTILNLHSLDQGSISINGLSHKSYLARERLGYLPEKFTFYSYYSAEETLLFFSNIFGLPARDLSHKVEEALIKVNMLEFKKNKLQKLSKGQLQRIGLAALILHPGDLLILDEPFSGLDPIGIKEFKEVFLDLKQKGKTLFINSHLLSEVEKVCDEMAILNKGKVLVKGPLSDLSKDLNLEEFFYKTIKQNQ